jgi:hypothetical protein
VSVAADEVIDAELPCLVVDPMEDDPVEDEWDGRRAMSGLRGTSPTDVAGRHPEGANGIGRYVSRLGAVGGTVLRRQSSNSAAPRTEASLSCHDARLASLASRAPRLTQRHLKTNALAARERCRCRQPLLRIVVIITSTASAARSTMELPGAEVNQTPGSDPN